MDSVTKWQEQMRQQEKMASLGKLTAGIAHEIQNPLNFVINFSKMSQKLLDDLYDIMQMPPEELTDDDRSDLDYIITSLKDNISKIEEHGDRATTIVRDILLYSRGKEGERIPSDIAHIVKEYIWLGFHAMRASHKDFNVAIHEQYQEGMPPRLVVPQDVSRAVLNLVNNAFYAVYRKDREHGTDAYKPEIDVTVKEEADNIIIVLSDNGVGMTADTKQPLSETFFTTKPAGQGTGLGMGITKEIVEDVHHGKLTFESEYGVGTTFTITLPIGA